VPRLDVKIRRRSPYTLVYSTSADRSNPTVLDQAQDLSGAIYVFVSPTTGVDSVDFYGTVGAAATRTDSASPFDLVGGTDTATASNFGAGDHTITAFVRSGSNAYELTATFNVLAAVHPGTIAGVASVDAPTINVTQGASVSRTVTPSVVSAAAGVALPNVLVSATGSPNLKGEVATAEAALIANPNVLWVGNYGSGSPAYKTSWGTTNDTWTSHQSVADYSATVGSGKGLTFRGQTEAYTSNGYGRNHDFQNMGLSSGYDEAYLRYRVFFPTNYPRINSAGGGGGKLPGFAGKVGRSSLNKVGSGGQRFRLGSTFCTQANYLTADSFSARLLWQKDRGLSCYIYTPDANHKGTAGSGSGQSYFGWSVRCKAAIGSSTDYLFTYGQWATIEQRIKMNTVGLSNGIYEVWVDGVKRLSVTNMIWRNSNNPSLQITQIYDSWFYGGPQASYDSNGNLISLGDAPETDAFIYFDDWAIGTAYIGV
jgi:hypothetical protein